jgi:hypothetical protein
MILSTYMALVFIRLQMGVGGGKPGICPPKFLGRKSRLKKEEEKPN